MLYYFRRYPLSLVIMAVIFYLSFFTPPKSNLEEIPNIKTHAKYTKINAAPP